MVDYKNKWNKYEIGKTSWINERRKHPARQFFVKGVKEISRYERISIIEIGAGECVEANQLKENHDYTIMDVSDTFLEHAKNNNIDTIKCASLLQPSSQWFV